MSRVINTRHSITSQLQNPTMSRQGVPVSFVDMNCEPPEPHADAPPPAPVMPDHAPPHLDPTPDEPNEDEDDRLDDEIEKSLVDLQNGYMRLYTLLAKRRAR